MAMTFPTCVVIVLKYENLLDSDTFRAKSLEM